MMCCGSSSLSVELGNGCSRDKDGSIEMDEVNIVVLLE